MTETAGDGIIKETQRCSHIYIFEIKGAAIDIFI